MTKQLGGCTGKGFMPGMSGNPKGRPRILDAMRAAKEFGDQLHGQTDKTKDQHLFELIYRRACQGDMQAARLYLGYRFGNPAQSVEMNANVNVRSPEEHADSIMAMLNRLSEEGDEPSGPRYQ
jgi:hypothetical protein